MKKSLYVFNPENDLALADGSWNYTAPKYAKKIRNDLQMLPVWYAEAVSAVLADKSKANCDFLNDIKRKFCNISGVTVFDACCSIDKIYPWGWSQATCYQMKQLVYDASVPSSDIIEVFRSTSHRRTTLRILQGLEYKGVMPKECHNLGDVSEFLNVFGRCIVKAPWSSSGKGVFLVTESNFDAYKPLIGGFIKKQGSVICEKFLDKVLDFAMEFKSEKGVLSFVGLSVFENNNRFSYERAVVGSYEVLLQKIVKYVSSECIDNLKTKLLEVLSDIIPKGYQGYFGLDMMIFKENGDFVIMPCIELNLRTTMGLVASMVGENVLEENKEGRMTILFHKSETELNNFLSHLKPPVVKCGRLCGGSLLLVPVYSDSRFTALVEIV